MGRVGKGRGCRFGPVFNEVFFESATDSDFLKMQQKGRR